MVVDIVGNAERRNRAFGRGRGAGIHATELLLDVADVGQVLLEDRVVGRTEPALHDPGFIGDRVEQTLLPPHVRAALGRRSGLAEDALVGDARVDRHWQRALVVTPGDGVEEHAWIAVARAGRRAHV